MQTSHVGHCCWSLKEWTHSRIIILSPNEGLHPALQHSRQSSVHQQAQAQVFTDRNAAAHGCIESGLDLVHLRGTQPAGCAAACVGCLLSVACAGGLPPLLDPNRMKQRDCTRPVLGFWQSRHIYCCFHMITLAGDIRHLLLISNVPPGIFPPTPSFNRTTVTCAASNEHTKYTENRESAPGMV